MSADRSRDTLPHCSEPQSWAEEVFLAILRANPGMKHARYSLRGASRHRRLVVTYARDGCTGVMHVTLSGRELPRARNFALRDLARISAIVNTALVAYRATKGAGNLR